MLPVLHRILGAMPKLPRRSSWKQQARAMGQSLAEVKKMAAPVVESPTGH